MASTKNNPRAHALGAELRQARRRKGMSQEESARALEMASHAQISRWETGAGIPDVENVASLLTVYGVFGEARDEILQLARAASDPNWVAPGVDPQLAGLMEYERKARRLTSVEPNLIPGLLQTEEYARYIMRRSGVSSGHADQRVTMRLGRRNILTKPRSAVQFHAIIGEAALAYSCDDPGILRDQLDEVLRMSELPNVDVWALPLSVGYTPASEGSFVLVEFAGADPVVQQEHYRSAVTLTDHKDAADYKAAADQLRGTPDQPGLALPPDKSREFIRDILRKLDKS